MFFVDLSFDVNGGPIAAEFIKVCCLCSSFLIFHSL